MLEIIRIVDPSFLVDAACQAFAELLRSVRVGATACCG